MPKPKYLWRCQAVYSDGSVVTHHFQSKTAATQWIKQRKNGYEADYGFEDGRDSIPPAKMVVISKSLPIKWEEEDESDNSH